MPTKTPDITPAQIVAVIGSIVGVLLTATVIDGNTAKLVVGLASIIVPFAFMIADAVIRHGRAHAVAIASATTVIPSQPLASVGVTMSKPKVGP